MALDVFPDELEEPELLELPEDDPVALDVFPGELEEPELLELPADEPVALEVFPPVEPWGAEAADVGAEVLASALGTVVKVLIEGLFT